MSDIQTATINGASKNNIASNRKEKHFTAQYSIVTSDYSQPVILRLYGTQSTNYACLWVDHEGVHISGGGKAGGYGYHRSSAAAQVAINNAGIALSQDIDGRGEGAIQDALKAIARALGLVEFGLIEAHA